MNKEVIQKYILNNIERTNQAYQIYKNKPTYYNANHIYNANKNIYDALNQLLTFDLEKKELQDIITYILHLEKWFIQFDKEKSKIQDIEDNFVFQAFEDHIPFPKHFLKDNIL